MKRNGTVAKIELFSPGYKIQINPKIYLLLLALHHIKRVFLF